MPRFRCLLLLPLIAFAAQAPPPSAPPAATAPATEPGRRAITPEMVAAFGGPSVQEQELRTVRNTLGCSAEEWKVIAPLLANLKNAQAALDPDDAPDDATRGWRNRDWSNGSFTGPGETARGEPRGFAAPSDNAPDVATDDAKQMAQSAQSQSTVAQVLTLSQAMADLHLALADSHATPDELHRRVLAVRAARERAQQAFDDAKDELLPLLTPRQVGHLEDMGYFE